MRASIFQLLSAAFCFAAFGASPLYAKDIAVCGASEGYAYYPSFGLSAGHPDAAKWVDDAISNGRMTLIRTAAGELDLLVADATGALYSTVNDGGAVIQVGGDKSMMAIVVVYPVGGTTESYTFLQSETGPEVIWSSNKFNTLVPRIAAFRAPCSFVDLE